MNEQSQRHCHTCQRPVLATRAKPNHLLHFIITFFTCGLWGLVWIFIVIFDRGPWHCQYCGGSNFA